MNAPILLRHLHLQDFRFINRIVHFHLLDLHIHIISHTLPTTKLINLILPDNTLIANLDHQDCILLTQPNTIPNILLLLLLISWENILLLLLVILVIKQFLVIRENQAITQGIIHLKQGNTLLFIVRVDNLDIIIEIMVDIISYSILLDLVLNYHIIMNFRILIH